MILTRSTAVIAAGIKKHHSKTSLFIALLGTTVLIYTMYVNYNTVIEIIGFIMLAVATYLDFNLRRWSKVSGEKGLQIKDKMPDQLKNMLRYNAS